MAVQLTVDVAATYAEMARRLPALALVLRQLAARGQLELARQVNHVMRTDPTGHPMRDIGSGRMLSRIILLLEFERYIDRERPAYGPRRWDASPTTIRYHLTEVGRAVATQII